ncbi:MAG: hypothetical protein HDR28_03810 [Lachnospiraceae bacterium]|nr:hypothetical protein [Lachnospiraceae bacterium]
MRVMTLLYVFYTVIPHLLNIMKDFRKMGEVEGNDDNSNDENSVTTRTDENRLNTVDFFLFAK